MAAGNKQLNAALGKILAFGSGLKQTQGLSLALSPAMGACLIIALIGALAWSFYMGFRVGRGENPAQGLPAVAALVDKAENEPNGAEQHGAEIAPVPPQPAPVPPIAQRMATEPPAPFLRPAGQGLDAWEQQKAAQGAEPAPKKTPAPAAKKTAPAKTGQDKFIFTYQVAALRSNRDAEALQKKLQGAGLKCSLRKSGKVVLAIITLRGTQTEAAALPQKLRGLKLGRPLLLSRKEIPAAPAKDKRKKK